MSKDLERVCSVSMLLMTLMITSIVSLPSTTLAGPPRITKMMGFFHPKELEAAARDLVGSETWDEQVAPDCFQGYWVNWENFYFFRSDAASLNAMMQGISNRDVRFSVILDPGSHHYHDPTKERDENATPDPTTRTDFMIYASPYTPEDLDANRDGPDALSDLKPVVQLTVYLGSEGVALEDLVFPEGVDVTTHGEVAGFDAIDPEASDETD